MKARYLFLNDRIISEAKEMARTLSEYQIPDMRMQFLYFNAKLQLSECGLPNNYWDSESIFKSLQIERIRLALPAITKVDLVMTCNYYAVALTWAPKVPKEADVQYLLGKKFN